MLTTLKLRDFRCFPALENEFAEGMNVIVGPNAQGKTSLLEAACVLLRLQSPRAASLMPLVRIGATGFVLDGLYARRHLQFYASPRRRKLALDSVVQSRSTAYLEAGSVVWFSNDDRNLVAGPAEERRRYLDFIAAQLYPPYRAHLKAYQRALRSRNHLLRAPAIRWREVAAFDEPLLAAGEALRHLRAALVVALGPYAREAHRTISAGETLELTYLPGGGENFAQSLAESREKSALLRQTVVGPHRDDLQLTLNGLGCDLASEGQQRTAALALRLSHAYHLGAEQRRPPLLLLDDVFGELDPVRRRALLHLLPGESQQIITTTHLDWAQGAPLQRVFELSGGVLRQR